MAVTEANLKKFVGFGRVYINSTAPSSFGSPTLTAGVPAGGEDMGATIGASEFHYNANVQTFEIEQATMGIVPIVQNEEAWAVVKLAESDYTNLRYYMQTFARTVGSREVLHVGGQIDVTGRNLSVVAEMPSAPGKYYGFMLYSAYVDGEVTMPIKRGDTGKVVEVTFRAAADTTRDLGDQLGQWFEDQ
jgi:hypothetical protein